MKKIARLVMAFAVLALVAASACVPPKILVSNDFLGKDRMEKIVLQRHQGRETFNVFLRVCDLEDSGNEANCKDTLILEDVVPSSVY